MPEKYELEVSARSGHGQDFVPVFHPARAKEKDSKGREVPMLTKDAPLEDAKALCVDFIKAHRGGGQGMEYRIRDLVTGNILG